MDKCPKKLDVCEKIAKQKQPCQKDAKSKKPTSSHVESHRTSPPILEFPHFLRIIGPKHVNIMMQFIPSAICYGLTSLILLTYASEWKQVLQYLPYYNGKYVVAGEESASKDED